MRQVHLVVLVIFSLIGQAQDFSKVKVWLDPISTSLMRQQGLEMDHGVIKPGVFIINDYDAQTLEWMSRSGIEYEVLVEDVVEYYRNRPHDVVQRPSRQSCFDGVAADTVPVPENFVLGSMAGFYTYEEYLAQLDSMHTLYPNLISAREAIDTFLSHEGRPIYWVRISDQANLNESEPEVLYTALHHAREPQSLTQLIFFMWHVLESYGNDAEITELIDETEMYFVPMLNPDGYVYNQNNDPNGGGMWRKNRRNNGNGDFGVDLNRNYGYEWAYDNQGSSPNPSSDVFRGPSGFSEPETQAIKWLCEQHEFGLALNYHSYGNYIIYPWGFSSSLSPDSNEFIAIASEMARYNDYVFGTAPETVGYTVNGVSDDWMYGEQQTKNKIYSMTPEVGAQSDGFWPAQSRILPLCQQNVHANLMMAHMAGDYTVMNDLSPSLLTSLTPSIQAEAIRLGLQFNGPYSFELEAVSANIVSLGAPQSLSTMAHGVPEVLQWTINLNASIQPGEEVEWDMVANFNGSEYRQRVRKIYGEPTTHFQNSGSMADFLPSTNWGETTEDFASPTTSMTDSPFSEYENATVSELEYNRIIDLRHANWAQLTFQAKWEIEASWDYAQILASPVEDNTWTPLCARYTVEGGEYQDEGQPLWEGVQNQWLSEEVDLSDFLGQRIKVKFRLVSDQFVTEDGFYFDDLSVISLLEEGAPFPDTGYVDTIGSTPDTTTGMHSYAVQSSVIFPNPVSEWLHIRTPGTRTSLVKIWSHTGVLLLERKDHQGAIDVSSLPPGSYILTVERQDGRIDTHRVVVIR